MNITKRTETEVRDSLHDAIDRMSIMEIVVLIFLVQMIRTREFVSHILPRPRKMLPAPVEETLFPGLDDLIATGCTDPEPDTRFSYAEYHEAVRDAIRNNKPYPPVSSFAEQVQAPTEEEWNRMFAGAPSYFSPPIPMPTPLQPLNPMFGLDSNGRYVRVGEISGSPPAPDMFDGVVSNPRVSRLVEPVWGMCTPSRGSITGYNPYRCNCQYCMARRKESREAYEACFGS